MSKYNDKIKEIKEASGSTGYSRPVEEKLAQTLLNDVDFCKKKYVKKGDGFDVKESYPVKEFRAGLKKTMKKQFDMDDAELKKIDDCEFNKETANAFADLANTHVLGCMRTGKAYVFDPDDDKTAKMQISLREMPAKVVEPTKPVKTDDGKYNIVPTGDKYQYTERTEITSTNKQLSTTKYKLK